MNTHERRMLDRAHTNAQDALRLVRDLQQVVRDLSFASGIGHVPPVGNPEGVQLPDKDHQLVPGPDYEEPLPEAELAERREEERRRILQRFHKDYERPDGSLRFPASKQGDLLFMVYKWMKGD